MARDRAGFVCHAHTAMVSYEVHHIWPLGYHGPDVPENKIKICPNAHADIHYLMERMLRGKPYRLSEYGPQVRAFAQQGHDAVIAYADRLASALEQPQP